MNYYDELLMAEDLTAQLLGMLEGAQGWVEEEDLDKADSSLEIDIAPTNVPVLVKLSDKSFAGCIKYRPRSWDIGMGEIIHPGDGKWMTGGRYLLENVPTESCAGIRP